MPCTPTDGLSHSYISQWANLTMLHQSPSGSFPSLDPIPSPARGRVRVRKTREEHSSADGDQEGHTPRGRGIVCGSSSRRSTCSPHQHPAQLVHVSSRGSLANMPVVGRSRGARLQVRHPAAPAVPNPIMNFRRLAHPPQKPVDDKTASIDRTPSDVTSRFVQRERVVTTPSPDLIFNMSPVLGYEGPSRPYRVASRLSGEPEVAGDGEFDVPLDRAEELQMSAESKVAHDPSFLYAYAWHANHEPSQPSRSSPLPPYETSLGFSTSRDTSDLDEESSFESTSGLISQDVLDEFDAVLGQNPCTIEPPAMPRLSRMHAKSDPLPARLSSVSSDSMYGSSRGHSARTQPIPIPKPAPRVPSDYGGVNGSLAPSAPRDSSMARWARAPSRLSHRLRKEVEHASAEDVTGEWCGTADAAPLAPSPVIAGAAATPLRRKRDGPPRKKRFFIGVGESYDGDMDSESSFLAE
ncbi:hypothetical protein BDV93DRAFT_325760 [Ceratobasidium sp. AG-I]|nr:hypothetical protein BDV93DRAFT_325760 [Ceratobasidium sp. AG-I]